MGEKSWFQHVQGLLPFLFARLKAECICPFAIPWFKVGVALGQERPVHSKGKMGVGGSPSSVLYSRN